jgi:DNA-binding transcriptional MerR regulator/methylmalonyl-CoA mutase cobalamin-binding subunit
MDKRHNIKVAARRTGLSQHVIRIWERRYNAVTPDRTETNRRLYSDADIERLLLLRRLTESGASISQIAGLSREELLEMLGADAAIMASPPVAAKGPQDNPQAAEKYLNECVEAVRVFDSRLFEQRLMEASVALGQSVLLERLLLPLLERIGDMWSEGKIKVAHEHLASAVIRSLLGAMVAAVRVDPNAPAIVVTTPSGQLHEFGALMAAVTAASSGWRVLYLGPNVPAVDIAAAVKETRSRVVALSIVYPPDDPLLINELRRLRQLLESDKVSLLVGGRAADGYRSVLELIDGTTVRDLDGLRGQLDSMRSKWILEKLQMPERRDSPNGPATN